MPSAHEDIDFSDITTLHNTSYVEAEIASLDHDANTADIILFRYNNAYISGVPVKFHCQSSDSFVGGSYGFEVGDIALVMVKRPGSGSPEYAVITQADGQLKLCKRTAIRVIVYFNDGRGNVTQMVGLVDQNTQEFINLDGFANPMDGETWDIFADSHYMSGSSEPLFSYSERHEIYDGYPEYTGWGWRYETHAIGGEEYDILTDMIASRDSSYYPSPTVSWRREYLRTNNSPLGEFSPTTCALEEHIGYFHTIDWEEEKYNVPLITGTLTSLEFKSNTNFYWPEGPAIQHSGSIGASHILQSYLHRHQDYFYEKESTYEEPIIIDTPDPTGNIQSAKRLLYENEEPFSFNFELHAALSEIGGNPFQAERTIWLEDKTKEVIEEAVTTGGGSLPYLCPLDELIYTLGEYEEEFLKVYLNFVYISPDVVL